MVHLQLLGLLAQVVPSNAAPAAAPSGAFVPSAIGASAAFAYFLNWLKNWRKFPLVTQHSTEINAIVRMFTSAASTLGVTFVWNSGNHTLLIGNLAFWSIAAGMGHWFTSYAIQHGWEKIFSIVVPVDVPKPEAGAVS